MDGETDEVYFEEIFFYQSNNDSLICLPMSSKPNRCFNSFKPMAILRFI